MRMGVLVEVVLMMDGDGEEVGEAGRYFEVFAARSLVKGRLAEVSTNHVIYRRPVAPLCCRTIGNQWKLSVKRN